MHLDLIDVFGSEPMKGNQLGVVHAADDLNDEQMLRLTQWLGYSETTFILPPSDPKADYRLRIFYPAGELPFAGHPTLGSCHAWLAAGGSQKHNGLIVQQCGAGLIEIKQEGDLLAFRAPALLKSGPLNEEERLEAIRVAGVDPSAVVAAVHVDNGPNWKLLLLNSSQAVLNAEPASKAPTGTDVGIAGPIADGGEADWELRAFFANQHGALVEDPVTGSFNAGVAMHLFDNGLAKGSFTAAQGRKTGADGRIFLTQQPDGSVWVGGHCKTIAQGANLPMLG